MRAALLGGPYDGLRADLTRTPPSVLVGEDREPYERVDDPETGEYLGGYAWAGRTAVFAVRVGPSSVGTAR